MTHSRRDLLQLAASSIPAVLSLASLSCITTHEPAPPAGSTSLQIGGAIINYTITGELPLPAVQISNWISAAAHALTAYFGNFPVKRVDIAITASGDDRISDGVTYAGRRIEIRLGRQTTPRDLERDWMMTHEMFHLAFPTLNDQCLWMGEGLSTYLEPLARARVGNSMTAKQVWSQFARNMPQGLPHPGDEGLDHTHTWGRTYWGGAIFWLQADVEIREETNNQRSLDTAIRAILQAGGNGAAHWPVAKVLQTADRATATKILSRRYNESANAPTMPDLTNLWHRLGVQLQGRQLKFDDTAPLAAIRRSMTEI